VRYVLAALVASALALGPAEPAAAQQHRKPGAGEAGRALVGHPLFSSDGKRIGRIIAMGVDDSNETVLVAEIERPLGIGSAAVAIPFDMLVRKAGRLELTITAAEVEERMTKGGRGR
jgi:PRC-barrel domain